MDTGKNSSRTSHRVSLLYNKRVSKALVAIERKSGRVIAMQLDGNPKICIISAYAPTEVSTDEKAKDDFYYELESLATSLLTHTITITAGNARICMDSHESNPQIFGPNFYHDKTNSNGHRMIALCQATSSRPAHSHFKNRASRLGTYQPPKSLHPQTQIDHIMINAKWWKS
jgi:hypothetical protein